MEEGGGEAPEAKKLRLGLEAAVGTGDVFDESDMLINSIGFCESELPNDPKERAELAVRLAIAMGNCFQLYDKVNGSGKTHSFGQVLLSDLAVNPYASDARAFVELGIWHKIKRATQLCLKQAVIFQQNSAFVESLSFKDMFMQKLMQDFGDEVLKLREPEADEPAFDERVMQNIAAALQSGADMFTKEEQENLVRSAKVLEGQEEEEEEDEEKQN